VEARAYVLYHDKQGKEKIVGVKEKEDDDSDDFVVDFVDFGEYMHEN
jgi:hypothetical protein